MRERHCKDTDDSKNFLNLFRGFCPIVTVMSYHKDRREFTQR